MQTMAIRFGVRWRLRHIFAAALYAAAASAATSATAPKPHIVYILTDDLGWNTAYNNPDIHSPTLNALAAEGLKLTSHYTYRYCSPTRAAFLTGRSPYKLLNIRENMIPTTIPESTDPRFTMLPKRLKEAGYWSVQVGKWHQGMAQKEWTPVGRGFDASFGFLAGGEDHFTQVNGHCKWAGPDDKVGDVTDYWQERAGSLGSAIASCDVPAADQVACPLYSVLVANGSATKASAAAMCAAGTFVNCKAGGGAVGCFQCKTKRYTAFDFTEFAVDTIQTHSLSTPMFMYLALHNTHAPTEATPEYIALYPSSYSRKRATFDAMVSTVDSTVKNVTGAMKATGMWENALVIWTTDNGSPVQVAGSNAPLRGTKGSDWEGGSRTPAFISGGFFLSKAGAKMGGRSINGIVTVWDMFATFAGLAGIDPKEPNPKSPTPVDSFDMWPYLTGAADASPRMEMVLDHLQFSVNTTACIYGGNVQVMPCNGGGAIRVGDLKLLVGEHGYAHQFGHFTPNASFNSKSLHYTQCTVAKPCLFNVSDPANGESTHLEDSRPADVARLKKRYDSYDTAYHPGSFPPPTEEAEYCEVCPDCPCAVCALPVLLC